MTDHNERNEKLNRIFAAIGLVFIIILLAWLAVQVVRFLPTAFSSLANVFEANQRQLHEQMDSDDEEAVVVVDTNEDDDTDEDVVVDDSTEDNSDSVDEVEDESQSEATDDSETEVNDSTTDNSNSDEVYYETVATYQVPVSDPNGYTELEVSYVAVGYLNSSERFVPNSDLEQDEVAAMQFKVKNTGTKTSTNWHFEAEFPDGQGVTSRVQEPLKPAETATFTVLFKTGDDRGYDHIGATVVGGNDISTNNNSFRTKVYIR